MKQFDIRGVTREDRLAMDESRIYTKPAPIAWGWVIFFVFWSLFMIEVGAQGALWEQHNREVREMER